MPGAVPPYVSVVWCLAKASGTTLALRRRKGTGMIREDLERDGT
jgi:hypothetical protein